MKKILWLTLLVVVISSCTTYQYHGRINATNSTGENAQALAYWQATHRTLWYDTYAGAIRVRTQCSPRTLVFNEREDGIVALWEPGLVKEDGSGGKGTICGRVIGAKRIQDLETGPLRVEVSCKAEVDEFSAASTQAAFLAPQATPYTFQISREEGKKAPQVARCVP